MDTVPPYLAAEQPLRVRLLCAHGRVRRVEAAWQRLPLERLWIGRSPQDIEPALTRVIWLCVQAHIGAARQAVRHAMPAALNRQGKAAPQAIDAAIRLEAARDTLRRWLLDYPRAFGGSWTEDALREWKSIDGPAALAAYCRAHIFGMAAQTWLALHAQALQAWIAAQSTLPARWLARGLAEPLRHKPMPPAVDLLEWAGAHAPELLQGSVPAPAPPHAQFDLPAAGRDVASALLLHRLRRLALVCAGEPAPEHGGFRCGAIGIGWARTARGLLLHLARIEDGRVAAYRILPPTFWNAAPTGLIESALKGLARGLAPHCAGQLLLLLDPCGPFDLTVTDAARPVQGASDA